MNVLLKCRNPYISKDGQAYACGQCESCRKRGYLDWTIRCQHENIYHEKCTFFTLTYKPKYLPVSPLTRPENDTDKCGTLYPDDTTKFIKRLRKHFTDRKLRYVYCGEYGPKSFRPHYHFILWGVSASELQKDDLLKKIWSLGHVDISPREVSNFCMQYVLGYVRKKLPTNLAKQKYSGNYRYPPFLRSSKGIGRQFVLDNAEKLADTLSVGYRGIQFPIPRYYVKQIYKMEGITQRFSVIREDLDGNRNFERYDYKVYPNPKGKYTSKLISSLIDVVIDEVSKPDDFGFMPDSDYKSLHDLRCLNLFRRIDKMSEDYLFISSFSDFSDFEHIKVIRQKDLDKPSKALKNTLPLSDKSMHNCLQIAISHCDEIKNGLFGQRNKVDTFEELFGYDG